MIIGIGNDVIDIRRIEETLNRFGSRFIDRIFTDVEIRKSERRAQRAASYAKRFAAKEACSKALGTGFRKGVFWKDMGVVNELSALARKTKSPVVRLYLASALQRMRLYDRWAIADALVRHGEDASDHNLPLMLWYGIEPLVPADPKRALALMEEAVQGARRQHLVLLMILTGDSLKLICLNHLAIFQMPFHPTSITEKNTVTKHTKTNPEEPTSKT